MARRAQRDQLLDVLIEPDLSNAGPFLAAALVTAGRVRVPDWPQHTTQAGDALRDILDGMGADVSLDRSGLTVTGTGEIEGIDVDLHDASELTRSSPPWPPSPSPRRGSAASPTSAATRPTGSRRSPPSSTPWAAR